MKDIIRYSIAALEIAGLSVIIAGAVASTAAFLGRLFRGGFDSVYRSYRADLGRCILLGLEFLIAADILKSILTDPTLGGLVVLAGIVLVRNFLSISLEVEINGHWPWESTRLTQDQQRLDNTESRATSLQPDR